MPGSSCFSRLRFRPMPHEHTGNWPPVRKSDQHSAPGMGTLDAPSVPAALHDMENATAHEVSITLECDKPGVDYEGEFEGLKRALADLERS